MIIYDQYQDYKDYCAIFPKYCMPYDHHFQEKEPKKTVNLIQKLFIQNILSDHQLFEYRVTPSIVRVIRLAQNGLEIDLTEVSAIIEMYQSFRNENDFSRIFENLKLRLKDEEADVFRIFYENNFTSYYFCEYLSIVKQQHEHDKSIFEQFFSPEETADILNYWDSKLQNAEGREFTAIAKEEIMKNLFSHNISQVKWLINIYKRINVYPECEEDIMSLIIEKIQAIEKPYSDTFEAIGQFIDHIYNIYNLFCDLFTSREANEHLEESIKEALNKEIDICEKLNIYIDRLVRDESEDSQAEEQSKHIICIYKYLEDKPKFENFYEKYFIHRFFSMKSAVFKFEDPIINAIRSVNRDFMTHYDKIKAQTEESEIQVSEFNEQLENKDKIKQIPFSPLIINQKEMPILYEEGIIPDEIADVNKSFTSFYADKHKNKSLCISQFSTVDLDLKIGNAKRAGRLYTVTTNLPCACVISRLCRGSAKFSEIVSIMNNDRYVAASALRSLFKLKLLTRKGKTPRLSDDDEFWLNANFTSKESKIIIPPISLSATHAHQEMKLHQENIDSIKAEIVRTVMAKNRIELQELEKLVIQKLNDCFECTHDMFQRAIYSSDMTYIKITHQNGRTFIDLN